MDSREMIQDDDDDISTPKYATAYEVARFLGTGSYEQSSHPDQLQHDPIHQAAHCMLNGVGLSTRVDRRESKWGRSVNGLELNGAAIASLTATAHDISETHYHRNSSDLQSTVAVANTCSEEIDMRNDKRKAAPPPPRFAKVHRVGKPVYAFDADEPEVVGKPAPCRGNCPECSRLNPDSKNFKLIQDLHWKRYCKIRFELSKLGKRPNVTTIMQQYVLWLQKKFGLNIWTRMASRRDAFAIEPLKNIQTKKRSVIKKNGAQMPLVYHPYQQDAIKAVVENFCKPRNATFCPGGYVKLPCGAGKTFIFLSAFLALGVPFVVLMDSTRLISQHIDELFDKFDIPKVYRKNIGAIVPAKSAKSLKDKYHIEIELFDNVNVLFVTAKTLKDYINQWGKANGPDSEAVPNMDPVMNRFPIIVVDEAHKLSDEKGSQITQAIYHLGSPDVSVYGFTQSLVKEGSPKTLHVLGELFPCIPRDKSIFYSSHYFAVSRVNLTINYMHLPNRERSIQTFIHALRRIEKCQNLSAHTIKSKIVYLEKLSWFMNPDRIKAAILMLGRARAAGRTSIVFFERLAPLDAFSKFLECENAKAKKLVKPEKIKQLKPLFRKEISARIRDEWEKKGKQYSESELESEVENECNMRWPKMKKPERQRYQQIADKKYEEEDRIYKQKLLKDTVNITKLTGRSSEGTSKSKRELEEAIKLTGDRNEPYDPFIGLPYIVLASDAVGTGWDVKEFSFVLFMHTIAGARQSCGQKIGRALRVSDNDKTAVATFMYDKKTTFPVIDACPYKDDTDANLEVSFLTRIWKELLSNYDSCDHNQSGYEEHSDTHNRRCCKKGCGPQCNVKMGPNAHCGQVGKYYLDHDFHSDMVLEQKARIAQMPDGPEKDAALVAAAKLEDEYEAAETVVQTLKEYQNKRRGNKAADDVAELMATHIGEVSVDMLQAMSEAKLADMVMHAEQKARDLCARVFIAKKGQLVCAKHFDDFNTKIRRIDKISAAIVEEHVAKMFRTRKRYMNMAEHITKETDKNIHVINIIREIVNHESDFDVEDIQSRLYKIADGTFDVSSVDNSLQRMIGERREFNNSYRICQKYRLNTTAFEFKETIQPKGEDHVINFTTKYKEDEACNRDVAVGCPLVSESKAERALKFGNDKWLKMAQGDLISLLLFVNFQTTVSSPLDWWNQTVVPYQVTGETAAAVEELIRSVVGLFADSTFHIYKCVDGNVLLNYDSVDDVMALLQPSDTEPFQLSSQQLKVLAERLKLNSTMQGHKVFSITNEECETEAGAAFAEAEAYRYTCLSLDVNNFARAWNAAVNTIHLVRNVDKVYSEILDQAIKDVIGSPPDDDDDS